MKNLSLILNFVLLIAVGILFYLHFSKPGQTSSVEKNDSLVTVTEVELPDISTSSGGIAYINYDSLTEKYEFFKKGAKDLENTVKRKEQEFAMRQQKYQEAVEKYQQLAPAMTDDQRAKTEGQLMEEQQRLVLLSEKLREELGSKQEQFNKQFLQSLDDYLKELSKKQNYAYVFTYTKGGPAHIVYANDSLEITNEVISGLNNSYKNKKGK